MRLKMEQQLAHTTFNLCLLDACLLKSCIQKTKIEGCTGQLLFHTEFELQEDKLVDIREGKITPGGIDMYKLLKFEPEATKNSFPPTKAS